MPTPLHPDKIHEALNRLDGWKYNTMKSAITRSFTFKDFREAWAFMGRVARLAEELQHHPEWNNTYNKVEIFLTTHDAGGVTEKDTGMAAQIDILA